MAVDVAVKHGEEHSRGGYSGRQWRRSGEEHWMHGGRKVQNVPVVHFSDIQQTFYDKHRFILKVADLSSLNYQFNLEERVISIKPLLEEQ